jgi:hypothetical protein
MGPSRVGHCSHQLGHLRFVGHVSREGLGDPAGVADRADDVGQLPLAMQAIDGHGQAIAGQTLGDDPAEPAGAAGDECDPILHRTHVRLSPLPGCGAAGRWWRLWADRHRRGLELGVEGSDLRGDRRQLLLKGEVASGQQVQLGVGPVLPTRLRISSAGSRR